MKIEFFMIPWICEKYNFCCSTTAKRNTFLLPFLEKTINNNDKTFINGDKITVSAELLLNAHKYNYMRVTSQNFEYYMFITNVSRETNNILRFDYKVDFFQTYFNINKFSAKGILSRTTSTVANAAFSLPLDFKGGLKLTEIKNYNPLNTERFAVVLFFDSTVSTDAFILKPITVISGTKFFTNLKGAFDTATQFSKATSFTTATGSYTYNETCKSAYVIPEYLIDSVASGTGTDGFDGKIKFTIDKTDFETSVCFLENVTFAAKTINKSTFAIDSSLIRSYRVGTLNNQTAIPINEIESFSVTLAAKETAKSLFIYYNYGDEIIDITAEFRCDIAVSPAATYAQNGYTNDVLSLVAGGVANVAAVGTAAAVGNIPAAALSVVSGANSIISGVTNISKNKNTVQSTRGQGAAKTNFSILENGFGLFVFTPSNAYEIESEINARGMVYETPVETIPVVVWADKWQFVKYSEITLINATIPLDARNAIENQFINGIYIKYAS